MFQKQTFNVNICYCCCAVSGKWQKKEMKQKRRTSLDDKYIYEAQSCSIDRRQHVALFLCVCVRPKDERESKKRHLVYACW